MKYACQASNCFLLTKTSIEMSLQILNISFLQLPEAAFLLKRAFIQHVKLY